MPLGAGANRRLAAALRPPGTAGAARLQPRRRQQPRCRRDRDFAVDVPGRRSLLGVHLSRLAEDLVLWCSPGFGWFQAPEGFSRIEPAAEQRIPTSSS